MLGYGTSAVPIDEVIESLAGILVRTEPLRAPLLAKAEKLRVIARRGVGVDNIDVAVATAMGVPVLITATANAKTVAEHVFGVTLALLRNMASCDRATRSHDFRARDRLIGHDLFTLTMGVVGAGRVGQEVARIARNGFGMKVVIYDPFIPRTRTSGRGLTIADDLEELLVQSDVVTIHVPLSAATHGLIDEARLRRMRKGATLIQTSRGGIVDETALVRVLVDGHLAGAAVDVFDREPPPPNHPLLALENVILSPHTSGLTSESVTRMSWASVNGVLDVLEGVSSTELLAREHWKVVNPEYARATEVNLQESL